MANVQILDAKKTTYSSSAQRSNPAMETAYQRTIQKGMDYIKSEKLFNVEDTNYWGTTIENGVTYYYMAYEDIVIYLTLKSLDGEHKLSAENNIAFDAYLSSQGAPKTEFTITYVDSSGKIYNSELKLTMLGTGISAIGIVVAGLACSVWYAFGVAANEAAADAALAIGEVIGEEVSVVAPEVGIVICILAFVGIWLAYIIERQISLSLQFENRSDRDIYLDDYSQYNLDTAIFPGVPFLLGKRIEGGPVPGMEFYPTIHVGVANYWKDKGVGLSMKFSDQVSKQVTICLRNDIYADPHMVVMAGIDPEDAYYKCTEDIPQGIHEGGAIFNGSPIDVGGFTVSLALDSKGYENYTFSGVIAFL